MEQTYVFALDWVWAVVCRLCRGKEKSLAESLFHSLIRLLFFSHEIVLHTVSLLSLPHLLSLRSVP